MASSTATLRGSVNPHGFEAKYRFEYGTTTSYGTSVPVPDKSAGSGTSAVKVNEGISGLKAHTTYHFRVAASSAEGTSFGKDETFTTKFDPPVATTCCAYVTSSTVTLYGIVNPNGLETTYRFEYGTTTSYGTSVPVPDKGIGSGSSDVEVSEGISELEASTTYHFRVAAINAEGTSFGKDEEFVTKAPVDPRFSFSFGSQGSGNGQFMYTQASTIDSGGNIWVVDAENHRVQKFNPKGEYLSQFGSKGSGNGQFYFPNDIAIDSTGNIWVVDLGNYRVEKFSSEGEYLSQFGSQGSGFGKFTWPSNIAIDSTGNIWVVDSGGNRVQKFNSEGKFLSKFGTEGEGNGQFWEPTGIAIDSTGNIWVVDANNSRVQKFNSKGEYLSQFGSMGSENGQFIWPSDIAFDSTGNIWVTDTYNYRVQRFNSKGEYLSQFGSEGYENGELSSPMGVAVDSADNVWVADTSNHRMQKWIPNRPAATTEAADEVTSSAATLNGTVNPNGLETTYRFEYGTTTSYGTKVPVPDKSAGSGSSGTEASEGVGGLKATTTYHFRVVATNAEGTSFGKDETFVTK